jgi:hypothetical protein
MNDPNKELKEFLYKYEAGANLSNRMYRRVRNIRFDYKYMDQAVDQMGTLPFEEEPMVEITMPQDRFRHLVEIEKFVTSADREREWAKHELERQRKEVWIRQKNDTVRKAYERYQTLLNLVRHDYD